MVIKLISTTINLNFIRQNHIFLMETNTLRSGVSINEEKTKDFLCREVYSLRLHLTTDMTKTTNLCT